MYYLGIDLGTSAAKILLLSDKNEIVKIISKTYPIYFPKEGWSEQNPSDWLNAVKEGIKEITNFLGKDSNKIVSIGIAGQMHGLVTLDKNDELIRNAILWNDGRTNKEVEYLNNIIGKENLVEYTGNIAFAGFTAPKILWMLENEPLLFKKIDKIMLPKDYINYMLTKNFVTDYSDASGTLLLDVKNKKWSKEMLEICSLKESMLPRLYESFEKIGTISKEVANELNLSTDCIVVAGASDNAAAAIGTGVIGDNECMVSLGTSGTMLISGDYIKIESPYGVHSFSHADGGYHLLGCMLSAASCVNWWNNILHLDKFQFDNEEELKFSNEIYFMPYLMGERTPHNDPFIRGAFVGIGMDTKRDDMTLSILEGVSFGMRDSLELVRKSNRNIQNIRLCGGGAKNIVWQQIMANILNVNILIMKSDEGASLGGAILASVGVGKYKNVKEAVNDIIEVKNIVKPNSKLVNIYNKKYEIFKKLYPALKDIR